MHFSQFFSARIIFCFSLIRHVFGQEECAVSNIIDVTNGIGIPFNVTCDGWVQTGDLLSTSTQQSFADCIHRCVQNQPLCYGIVYYSGSISNCDVMAGGVHRKVMSKRWGAVLDTNLLEKLPMSCISLGLVECFVKNGGFSTFTSSTSSLISETSSVATASSMTATLINTASMTPSGAPSVEPTSECTDGGGGLSTGAKAGIGVGVGSAILIAIASGIAAFLKRNKHEQAEIMEVSGHELPEKVGERDIPAVHGQRESNLQQDLLNEICSSSDREK